MNRLRRPEFLFFLLQQKSDERSEELAAQPSYLRLARCSLVIRERERERERERGRETERHTETETETDRETDRERHRDTETENTPQPKKRAWKWLATPEQCDQDIPC